jgi:hypothetical protein
LQNISLTSLTIIIPPYSDNGTDEEKIKVTLIKALRRSIELKNRLLFLTNAFFLGKLFSDSETTSIKFQRKRKISRHYAAMSEYVYDIFELCPSQILHTSTLTVQQIKHLKRSQVLLLRDIVENNLLIFAGAQN